MKLYKLTYETEIVILAEDEKEALANAQYYVSEEEPKLQECEVIETEYQLETYCPGWKVAVPYSAKREYNVDGKRCGELVK